MRNISGPIDSYIGKIKSYYNLNKSRNIILLYDNHDMDKYCKDGYNLVDYLEDKIKNPSVYILLEEFFDWSHQDRIKNIDNDFLKNKHIREYLLFIKKYQNQPNLELCDIRNKLLPDKNFNKYKEIFDPNNIKNGDLIIEIYNKLENNPDELFEFSILLRLLFKEKIKDNYISEVIFFGGAEHCRKIRNMLKKINITTLKESISVDYKDMYEFDSHIGCVQII